MEKRYIERAEVAKMIRRDLKASFPATKFSVRSRSYSMGGEINVSWSNGPTEEQINDLVGSYQSSGFDGMIDLAYSYDHWLLPDGTVQLAGNRGGTTGSMGTVSGFETDKPDPAAEKVHLMTGYVWIHRSVSPGFVEQVKAAWAALDERERFELMEKSRATRALSPFEMPDSWRLDAELSDFGDKAGRLFEQMARQIPA
jgi:hypothetical protein